jgi:hypothetical protein
VNQGAPEEMISALYDQTDADNVVDRSLGNDLGVYFTLRPAGQGGRCLDGGSFGGSMGFEEERHEPSRLSILTRRLEIEI